MAAKRRPSVRVAQNDNGDATLSVNENGAGENWTDVAILSDVSAGETIRVVLDEDGTEADVPVAVA